MLLDASCLIATVLKNVLLIAHEIVSDICLFILFAVTTDKMTKKKPRFGALPTLNMPIRSIKTVIFDFVFQGLVENFTLYDILFRVFHELGKHVIL